MNRSILLTLAAVAALATAPSLAASAASTTTENWEQASRAYAAYAFGPVAAEVDATETGSIATMTYVPYTGFGDPLGVTSSSGPDPVETGSIVGAGAPRVDVEAFCEGEGRMLAARHYIGFCHPPYDR